MSRYRDVEARNGGRESPVSSYASGEARLGGEEKAVDPCCRGKGMHFPFKVDFFAEGRRTSARCGEEKRRGRSLRKKKRS